MVLSEFDAVQLSRDPTSHILLGRTFMAVRGGRLVFVSPGDWAGKTLALLVVPPGRSLKIFEPYMNVRQAQPVQDTDGKVFVLQRL
jgi:hypothetical protein